MSLQDSSSQQPYFLDFIHKKPEGYTGFFSSGPCPKPKGYKTPKDFIHSRSHRSPEALWMFRDLLHHLKILLEIPEEYKLLLVPGSCSGAMDMALWNFLGPRPVSILQWDVFSKMWCRHVQEELKLNINTLSFYDVFQGKIPPVDHDFIVTFSGTSSGLTLEHHHEILRERKGLVLCDGAAAVGCCNMPWPLLDVTCFSAQKALGGEAHFGFMVLSPKAMERLKSYTPPWPMNRLIGLKTPQGSYNDALERGETINTVSLLTLQENWELVHYWLQQGGLSFMTKKTCDNKQIVESYCFERLKAEDILKTLTPSPKEEPSGIQEPLYIQRVVEKFYQTEVLSTFFVPHVLESSWRSSTPFLFTPPPQHDFHHFSLEDQWIFIRETANLLAKSHLMYDIINHALDRPMFRLWTGPSVDKEDLMFAMEIFKSLLIH